MKRFLAAALIGMLLLFMPAGLESASPKNMNTIKLPVAESFVIDESFPQFPLKNFVFGLATTYDKFETGLIIGVSIYDPSYVIYFIVSTIKGKTYVIGCGTMSHPDDLKRQSHYGDMSFLKSGIPSCKLTPRDSIVTIKDIDKVPEIKSLFQDRSF